MSDRLRIPHDVQVALCRRRRRTPLWYVGPLERVESTARTGTTTSMIGILIAILLAVVVYWVCVALGLPFVVAIIAAILVLLAGIGGYGWRGRGAPPP